MGLFLWFAGTANAAPLYTNAVDIDYLVGGDFSLTVASTTNPWVNGSFGAIQIYLGAVASSSVQFTLYDGNTESNHKDCTSGVLSVASLGAPVSPSVTYADLELVTIPMTGTECVLTDFTGGFDEHNTGSEVVGAEFALLGTGASRYIKVLGGTADNIQCDDCTRVIDRIAPIPEYVYFITPDVSYEYYVNSDDVMDTDNVYFSFHYDSVKVAAFAQTDDTNLSGGGDDHISVFDEPYFFNSFMSDLTATGTYNMTLQIEERVYPPWWNVFAQYDYTSKILYTEQYRFHYYEETDAQELAQIIQSEQDRAIAEFKGCLNETTTECFKLKVDQAVNAIIYAPPLGYGVYLMNMLMSTTSATSTIAITISFPTSSPAYGLTQELNVTTGLQGAITSLDSITMPGNVKSVFDTLMDYWIWFLRIALGFYILRRVFGMYNLSIMYNPDAGDYQREGFVRGVRSGRSLNDSRFFGGESHSLKIKSYD